MVVAPPVHAVLMHIAARQVVLVFLIATRNIEIMFLIEGEVADQQMRPIVVCVAVASAGPYVVDRVFRVVFIRKCAIYISPYTRDLLVTVNWCESRVGIGLIIRGSPSVGIDKTGYFQRTVKS